MSLSTFTALNLCRTIATALVHAISLFSDRVSVYVTRTGHHFPNRRRERRRVPDVGSRWGEGGQQADGRSCSERRRRRLGIYCA
eukprot:4628863-Prymnesium_polylepis.1